MTSDVQTPLPALPIGPAGAGKWDIRFGLAAAGVFLMHVVLVVLSACPFWTMCFPLPKIGGFLWAAGALVLIVVLLRRVFARRAIRDSRRVLRIVLALLLVVFVAHSLSRGDYRWFEMGMRWRIDRCGGAGAIQAWAERELNSPTYAGRTGNDPVDLKTLPPNIRRFARADAPLYIGSEPDGPWFLFDHGGLDMGCGVIVGKTSLQNPSPIIGPGRYRGWIKQLRPGLFLYAF
jgi:hypothetical protein